MSTILEKDKLYVLLNSHGRGGFALSKQCEEEYERRTGKPPAVKERLAISFEQPFGQSQPVEPCNIRIDRTLLDILKEKGAAWCSGPQSWLRVEILPCLFEEYIEIQSEHGAESISIDLAEVYESFLEGYLRDHPTPSLESKFRHIQESIKCIPTYSQEALVMTQCDLARPLEEVPGGPKEAAKAKEPQDDTWHVVTKRTYKKVLKPVSDPVGPAADTQRIPCFNRFYLESDEES